MRILALPLLPLFTLLAITGGGVVSAEDPPATPPGTTPSPPPNLTLPSITPWYPAGFPQPYATWVGLNEIIASHNTTERVDVELLVVPSLSADLTNWTLATFNSSATDGSAGPLSEMKLNLKCPLYHPSDGGGPAPTLCLLGDVHVATEGRTNLTISSPAYGSWTALLERVISRSPSTSRQSNFLLKQPVYSQFSPISTARCGPIFSNNIASPNGPNACGLSAQVVLINEVRVGTDGFVELDMGDNPNNKDFTVAVYKEGVHTTVLSGSAPDRSPFIVGTDGDFAPDFGSYGFVAVWPHPMISVPEYPLTDFLTGAPWDALVYTDEDHVQNASALATQLGWLLTRSLPVGVVSSPPANLSVTVCNMSRVADSGLTQTARVAILQPPSPGAANACPRPLDRQLVVSEVNAHTTSPFKEYIELEYLGPRPFSLDQVYVALVTGNGTIYSVLDLMGKTVTASRSLFLIGSSTDMGSVTVDYDVTEHPFLHNGPAAVVVYFRLDSSDLMVGELAPSDGWSSALVYSKRYGDTETAIQRQLGYPAMYVEDVQVQPFGDESLSRCLITEGPHKNESTYQFQVTVPTPGTANNCSVHRTGDTVFINEVQLYYLNFNNTRNFWVELAGKPNAPLEGLQLLVNVKAARQTVGKPPLLPPRLDLSGHLDNKGLFVVDVTERLTDAALVDSLRFSQGIELLHGNLLVDFMLYQRLPRGQSRQGSIISINNDQIDRGKTISRCIIRRRGGSIFSIYSLLISRFPPEYVVADGTPGERNKCGTPPSDSAAPSVLLEEVSRKTTSQPNSYVRLRTVSGKRKYLDGYILVVWEEVRDGDKTDWKVRHSFDLAFKSSNSQGLITIGTDPNSTIVAPDDFLPSWAGIGLYYTYYFYLPVGTLLSERNFTRDSLVDGLMYVEGRDSNPPGSMVTHLFKDIGGEGEVLAPWSDGQVICRYQPSDGRPLLWRDIHAFGIGTGGTRTNRSSDCSYSLSQLVLHPNAVVAKLLVINEVHLAQRPGDSFFELWYKGSEDLQRSVDVTFVVFNKTDKRALLSTSVALVGGEVKANSAVAFDLTFPQGTIQWKDVLAVALFYGAGPYNVVMDTFGDDLIDAILLSDGSLEKGSLSPDEHPILDISTISIPQNQPLQRCFSSSPLMSTAHHWALTPTRDSTEMTCQLPRILLRQLCLENSTTGDKIVIVKGSVMLHDDDVSFFGHLPSNFVALVIAYTSNDTERLRLKVPSPFFAQEDAVTPLAAVHEELPAADYKLSIHIMQRDSTGVLVRKELYAAQMKTTSDNVMYSYDHSSTTFVVRKSFCLRACVHIQESQTLRYSLGLSLGPNDVIPQCVSPPVIISEVNADSVKNGVDKHEFVELKGIPGMSAEGLWLGILGYKGRVEEPPLQLKGNFTGDGYYVIGSTGVTPKQHPLWNIKGILPDDEIHGIALYYANKIEHPRYDLGLLDLLVYSTESYLSGPVAPSAANVPLLSKVDGELVIERFTHPILGNNATMARCYGEMPRNQTCFGLSWTPTPGRENFCLDEETLQTFDHCVDFVAAGSGSSSLSKKERAEVVEKRLLTVLSIRCVQCRSNTKIVSLSDTHTCPDGTPEAYTTRFTYHVVGNTAAQVTQLLDSADDWVLSGEKLDMGNTTGSVKPCPQSCYASSVVASPVNSGLIAAVVVLMVVGLVSAVVVSVYCLKKTRDRKRNQMMARFEANYDEDGEEDLTVSDGMVSFSDPFAANNKSQTYRLL